MATQARNESALSLVEIDVSRAELWKEDRFTPLFTRLRAEDPVHFCPESGFGPYWSVTRHADIIFVVLAWVFVIFRWAQAGVHVTSNKVSIRGATYFIGAIVLVIMWVVFIVRILLGLP